MSRTLKKMILIIEDDTPIRDSIKELLEDEGYRVSAASNGQEALDMLRASNNNVC
jgi:CheY-like chemotaxis protein